MTAQQEDWTEWFELIADLPAPVAPIKTDGVIA